MRGFLCHDAGQTVKVENRVKALEGDVKTLKGQLDSQNGLIATMQSRLNELADRNAEDKKKFDILADTERDNGSGQLPWLFPMGLAL